MTDSSRPRRLLVAAAMLGVLAVLVLAAGWALSADAPPEGATGVVTVAVVAAGHSPSTADAYRRSDLSRRPPQLPTAPAVVAVLVAVGLGRHHRPTHRAVPAPQLAWSSPWGSRAPPPLLPV